MKKLILLFIAVYLFSCDTSSVQNAKRDYSFYKQKYIESLLDSNKQEEISALKEIVTCGKFLGYDVKKYENKYYALTSKKITYPKNKSLKPKNAISKPKAPTKRALKKYIKILSYDPLQIAIPNEKIKIFTLKGKNYYKKVIDIPNALVSRFVKKKLTNGILLKIAQFNPSTVRVVFQSDKPFKFSYNVKNKLLIAYLNRTQKPKLLPLKLPKRKKIIVIDPGHGGKDVGGVGLNRRYEKVAVLNIAKYLKYYLEKRGYKVYMTRYGDYFVPLKKRTHYANMKKADLFVSIHCNIAPKHIKSIHGIETYFLSPTRNERAIRVARLENKEIKGLNYLDQRVILNFLNRDRIVSSNKLGIDVQSQVLKALRAKYSSIKDGGVRPAPFWVLVGTQMPAILIETGYLTNPTESKRLFNPYYQRTLAKGIAEGIVNYFRKNP